MSNHQTLILYLPYQVPGDVGVTEILRMLWTTAVTMMKLRLCEVSKQASYFRSESRLRLTSERWEVRGDTDTLQIICCCPAVTWQCPCGIKRQCTVALDQWAWLYGCFSSTLASSTEYVYRNVAKRKFWLSDLATLVFIQNLIWRDNKESYLKLDLKLKLVHYTNQISTMIV